MNLLRVSWRNLRHKPFATSVSVMLMSLGIAMVSLMLHLSGQIDSQFKKNIKGIQMVVGAKGSPTQLILSSIYHIDAPTGNIDKEEVEKALGHSMVKSWVPLAFGDSYKGYKILGTTEEYLELYEAEMEQGRSFEKNLEVVIGAAVAERLGLGLGDYFHGIHGSNEKDTEHAHEHHDYTVVGILKPSGLVLDQLIICNIPSVWQIHEEEGGAEKRKEYTSALVTFKSKMGQVIFPQLIQKDTNLQCAMPSIEINNLINQLSFGTETLRLLAVLIIIISSISVFLSLLSKLRERKYELALMRSLGAHPLQLCLLLLYEGLLIALVSGLIGIFSSRLLLLVISGYIDDNFHYSIQNMGFLEEEFVLLASSLGIALLASLIPALIAFRIDISKTLAED